jgi:hypothetical protein
MICLHMSKHSVKRRARMAAIMAVGRARRGRGRPRALIEVARKGA